MLFLHTKWIICNLYIHDNVKLEMYSLISTCNMACNYILVYIKFGALHVFYLKKLKKDPCSSVFFFRIKHKNLGWNAKTDWNRLELNKIQDEIFYMCSYVWAQKLIGYFSMSDQVLSFDFPPNENAYKCIEKDLSNAWELKKKYRISSI